MARSQYGFNKLPREITPREQYLVNIAKEIAQKKGEIRSKQISTFPPQSISVCEINNLSGFDISVSNDCVRVSYLQKEVLSSKMTYYTYEKWFHKYEKQYRYADYVPGDWEKLLEELYDSIIINNVDQNDKSDTIKKCRKISKGIGVILRNSKSKEIHYGDLTVSNYTIYYNGQEVFDGFENKYESGDWESIFETLVSMFQREENKKIRCKIPNKTIKNIHVILGASKVGTVEIDGIKLIRDNGKYQVYFNGSLVYSENRLNENEGLYYVNGSWESLIEYFVPCYARYAMEEILKTNQDSFTKNEIKSLTDKDLSISIKEIGKAILMALGNRYSYEDYNEDMIVKYNYKDYGLEIDSDKYKNLDSIKIKFNDSYISNVNSLGSDVLYELYKAIPLKLKRMELALQNQNYCIDLYKRLLYLLDNNILNEKDGEIERIFYDIEYGYDWEGESYVITKKTKVLIDGKEVLRLRQNSHYPYSFVLEYSPGDWEKQINEFYNYYHGKEQEKENEKNKQEKLKHIIDTEEKAKVYIKQLHNIK